MSDQAPEENNKRSSNEIEEKEKASKPRLGFFKRLMDWVNVKFSNIFSASHWIYTVIFFAGAVVLAICSARFSGALNVALYASTMLIFTFLLLFVFSSIKKIAPYILEGKLLRRVIMFIVFFAISLVLVIVLFYESDQIPPPNQKYHYENMLPVIYIIVFFAWNAIQIYFIVKGMDGIAVKVEAAIFVKGIPKEQKVSRGKIWLIVCIVIPPAVQAAIIALLLTNNQGITAMNIDATGQLIFAVWFGAIIILLAAASLNAWRLYKQTLKHDTPSVLLSFLHMLFLVYILYRSYEFINSAGKVFQGLTGEMPASDQIIDMILIILALLLLFQGLGTKLGKVSLFSKNNVPFFAYLIATAFITGQVAILIVVPLPPPFVSTLSNLMMMVVAMIYYFVYLKHKLMDDNYLERDTFSA
ncbi:MAG TPA: hypothetical protein VKM55_31090, partial [Candidatus Lokiarchaeia archaeon]|nr:hypothetical protein [Candidatus Lokiarchaeia archaeon]